MTGREIEEAEGKLREQFLAVSVSTRHPGPLRRHVNKRICVLHAGKEKMEFKNKIKQRLQPGKDTSDPSISKYVLPRVLCTHIGAVTPFCSRGVYLHVCVFT